MAAETQYTANTGMVQFSTANTSLTGGTIGTNIFTVITGASNGTLIKNVTIKATGTPSQGMVRLFVYDGTNQRLLQEIEVNPIEQSGVDISFEVTVMLNFKLSRGWSLLASAQNSDTFNVIAEGLNINYFSSYVRPESTNYAANTGVASISTGTSSMTGSGSTLLLTATSSGYNGTAIESITIKATAATSADGMVRIFIYNGSTYYLFTEVFVLYSSQSGTYESFEHKIIFPEKLQLQSGYSLYVSTQNSDSFHVVAEAMDWNYPGGALTNFTATSGTNTTSEELLHSIQVPSSFVFSGGLFEVYANIATNNNANSKTFKIYIATTNSISTGTKVLLATYTTASTVGDNISRYFPVIDDTHLECYGGTGTSTQNEYANTLGTSASVDVSGSGAISIKAGFWILISGTKPTTGTDTDTIRWSMVRKIF